MHLKKHILLLSMIFSSIFILSCASQQYTPIKIEADLNAQQQETVVLLHGMLRDASAMRGLERYFQSLGYDTLNISYPSTQYSIQTLVEDYLALALVDLGEQKDKKVHFVTHSMGGILVRYYLQEHKLDNLGHVVMLAPPNKGTEIVDTTMSLPFSDPNPATLQLSAKADSFVNKLTAPYYSLGIIAGNKNNNIITAPLLPGEDDGVVSVKSTQLSNMSDFITVPLKHYRLRNNKEVMEQSAYFLQHGKFYKIVAD